MVQDHLGSTRMVVDRSGSLAGIRRHDYLPFGEELSAGVGIRSASLGYVGDSVRQKFTGYEKDNETGLDFAQARYFSNIQGRFTSVDPLNPVIDYTSDRTFYKFIAQPQNWNGYAFNRNNPLKYVDRNGKFPVATAAAGAVIGFFVGAGIELVKQAVTMQPGESTDWGKIVGAGVRGAVVGGVAGATGGLSFAPYVFATGGANVVGGIAGRAAEVVTNSTDFDRIPGGLEGLGDYALDIDLITVDGIAGIAGGLAGKFAEYSVIGQLANRYLNNPTFKRAEQTLRNASGKSDKQITRARQIVQSGRDNFSWWLTQIRDKIRSATTAAVTGALKKDERRESGGSLSRICDERGKNCTRQ